MTDKKTELPNRKCDEIREIDRRDFLATTAAVSLGAAAGSSFSDGSFKQVTHSLLNAPTTFEFQTPDTLFHGHDWQSLNPGYWKIQDGALRRRLKNVGDRARRTGFPYHGETHGFEFKTEYDPSLPVGIIYQPNWNLRENYSVKASFTFRCKRPLPAETDDPGWHMYQDGYGLMGIAIGGKSVYESYGKVSNAWNIGWTDDGKLRMIRPGNRDRGKQSGNQPFQQPGVEIEAMDLLPGDRCELLVSVSPSPTNPKQSKVVAKFSANGKTVTVTKFIPKQAGYVGIASRGLIDFEVNQFEVIPEANQPLKVGISDCLVCYPLGDTLKQKGKEWTVRFVALFASDGTRVEIRVHDSPSPKGGWGTVAGCGSAKIINNPFRRNTAIIDVTLPANFNPNETELFYTVWKDGIDVTADGRLGTDACGPGTALVGDVPTNGNYVGRLPRLTAPYKLCGLSCHAITSGLQQRDDQGWKEMAGGRDVWQFRDQPTVEAYKHLEEYDFQVMVWEDDVWYMELVMYPPSTDDAYKIIELSICGPTSRWQMMRHWNVINPGDHDYGMDDVKGPEQLAIRKQDGLGQDSSYLRRNFQIVHHLTTGAEESDPVTNPKKWRAWKMPNRDFTLIVLDSRLWRSSQDVDIWDDQGWDKFKSLYDRTDPTRSLLGEEQFGWLKEQLSTDSSPLICLTGINGLHTIWAGAKNGNSASKDHPKNFEQRDRVTADYAGWVKAGSDRVLELLGSREGIVSVYGDVHNGSITNNVEHRVLECSFGPIGRTGGRALIPGFGPKMKDVDEREIEIHSLYHRNFKNAEQEPHDQGDPVYWNFLEMTFDPDQDKIELALRNIVDHPDKNQPRGRLGKFATSTAETGRMPSCKLPAFKTLKDAEVFISQMNGKSIRGARSSIRTGELNINGLVDIEPGTKVLVTAVRGNESESQVLTTIEA